MPWGFTATATTPRERDLIDESLRPDRRSRHIHGWEDEVGSASLRLPEEEEVGRRGRGRGRRKKLLPGLTENLFGGSMSCAQRSMLPQDSRRSLSL